MGVMGQIVFFGICYVIDQKFQEKRSLKKVIYYLFLNRKLILFIEKLRNVMQVPQHLTHIFIPWPS